jgi:phage I-like protein
MSRRATLSVELDLSMGPPQDFRIFPAGSFETTKGTFLFDGKAAQSVMAAVADWGNDYCVDYGHSMLGFFNLDPAKSMKAAAWFTPQLRQGELWATAVRWNDEARSMLGKREARYVSPAFNIEDGDDNRISELINVALTNIPATKKQTPLVTSRDRNDRSTSRERPMSKKNRNGNSTNAFVLYKLGLPPDASEADVMAALDGVHERARVAESTKARIEADAKAKAEAEEKARAAREGTTDLATLAAKGAADATTSDKSRADSEKQLIELTGAKSYGEALGVVLSLKADVARIPQLEAELAQLKTQGQGATAEMLVEQGIREGKISPAQKELWLQIGKKNPEMLAGFLKTASAVVPRKPAESPEHKPRIALTPEQLKAAAKMGITDPKALEKLQEQMAEAAAIRATG